MARQPYDSIIQKKKYEILYIFKKIKCSKEEYK